MCQACQRAQAIRGAVPEPAGGSAAATPLAGATVRKLAVRVARPERAAMPLYGPVSGASRRAASARAPSSGSPYRAAGRGALAFSTTSRHRLTRCGLPVEDSFCRRPSALSAGEKTTSAAGSMSRAAAQAP